MADDEVLEINGKPIYDLRVTDLKKELEKRGLSKSGNKRELLERLKAQLKEVQKKEEKQMLLEKYRAQMSAEDTDDEDAAPDIKLQGDTPQNDLVKEYLQKRKQLLQEQSQVKKQWEEEQSKSAEESGHETNDELTSPVKTSPSNQEEKPRPSGRLTRDGLARLKPAVEDKSRGSEVVPQKEPGPADEENGHTRSSRRRTSSSASHEPSPSPKAPVPPADEVDESTSKAELIKEEATPAATDQEEKAKPVEADEAPTPSEKNETHTPAKRPVVEEGKVSPDGGKSPHRSPKSTPQKRRQRSSPSSESDSRSPSPESRQSPPSQRTKRSLSIEEKVQSTDHVQTSLKPKAASQSQEKEPSPSPERQKSSPSMRQRSASPANKEPVMEEEKSPSRKRADSVSSTSESSDEEVIIKKPAKSRESASPARSHSRSPVRKGRSRSRSSSSRSRSSSGSESSSSSDSSRSRSRSPTRKRSHRDSRSDSRSSSRSRSRSPRHRADQPAKKLKTSADESMADNRAELSKAKNRAVRNEELMDTDSTGKAPQGPVAVKIEAKEELEVNGSNEGKEPERAPVVRRRRWGSTRTVSTKTTIVVSTDSLKGLIPEIKPNALNQEPLLELTAPEEEEERMDLEEESGQQESKEEEDWANDQEDQKQKASQAVPPSGGQKQSAQTDSEKSQVKDDEAIKKDLKIQRTVIQEVNSSGKEGAQTGAGAAGPGDVRQVEMGQAAEKVAPKEKPKEVARAVRRPNLMTPVPTADDPQPSRRSPSPARNPVSNIVHVRNLVRPYTLDQLKEVLGRTGKLLPDGFWIDKIKSHCYATYETEDEAKATRQALHGTRWPSSNPKLLRIEYATQDEIDYHKSSDVTPASIKRQVRQDVSKPPPGPEEAAAAAAVAAGVTGRESRDSRDTRDGRLRKDDPRARLEAPPMREWDRDKLRQSRSRSRERRESDRRRADERAREKSREREKKKRDRSKERKERKEKKEEVEEVPAKLLDDLFCKTKATPFIYWLPLTEEQALLRDQKRKAREEERERRRKEVEKQEEEARRQREKEREERNRNRDQPPVRSNERDRGRERDRSDDRIDRNRDRDRPRRSRSRSRGGGGGRRR